MNDLEAFAKLVQAIDPWRAQLVFIGGWGHRLHTLHPKANKLDYQPVFTKDTDLAFHSTIPLEGDIKSALMAKGFKEALSGEFKPPIASYTLGDEQGGFYAEFLTPLIGSGYKRGGAADATLQAAGISAQKIRHLDILMVDPWTVTVGLPHNEVPLDAPVELRVANPLCFMVQKFLIKKDRKKPKQSQDLLYVYDTIQLFFQHLPQFKDNWEAVVKPALQGASETVLKECAASFASITDELRGAAAIPQDRNGLTAAEMQSVCKYAFSQIMGI
ncbi:MAG: hypothetical protein JWR60_4158 [Polaromonas sp.]|nr:hypothetical protein [Polaromonas sp.]